jgi:hypothetical protein
MLKGPFPMTASFNRTLNDNLLAPGALEAFPLFGQLLALWATSGIDSNNGERLRLAIRDGYVNVYAHGQSVFKVKFYKRHKKLSFEIHWKYVGDSRQTGSSTFCSTAGALNLRS